MFPSEPLDASATQPPSGSPPAAVVSSEGSAEHSVSGTAHPTGVPSFPLSTVSAVQAARRASAQQGASVNKRVRKNKKLNPPVSIRRDTAQTAAPELDHIDRTLLTLLDAHPTAPIASYAEQMHTSAHTLSRRLARLERTGVVRVVGRTHPGFGGRRASIVRVTGARTRLNFYGNQLGAMEHTRWVRLSRAGTELMCGFVDGAQDLYTALHMMGTDPLIRSIHTYDLMHIWTADRARLAPPRVLDAVDRAILVLMEENGRRSVGSIARAVGVDASTVSRRRKRLVDEGIVYFEADIHPAALTAMSDFMLWVGVCPGRIRQLGAHLFSLPQVRFVAATSGRSTLVAHAVFPDETAVLEFLDEQLEGYPIVSLETVSLQRVFKRNA